MKTGHVYSMNCDCGSYHKVRRTRPAWISGPRCPGCGAILGWMQWTYLGKASGVNEKDIIANAIQACRKAAKAAGGEK